VVRHVPTKKIESPSPRERATEKGRRERIEEEERE